MEPPLYAAFPVTGSGSVKTSFAEGGPLRFLAVSCGIPVATAFALILEGRADLRRGLIYRARAVERTEWIDDCDVENTTRGDFSFCAELAVIPCVLAREMNDLARIRIVGASRNYLSVHDDLVHRQSQQQQQPKRQQCASTGILMNPMAKSVCGNDVG